MSAATSNIEIRKLDPVTDFDFAMQVFERCTDYVLLETGEPPTRANVTEFFENHPPNATPAKKLLLGIRDEQGKGLGLIDILQEYPEPSGLVHRITNDHPRPTRPRLGKIRPRLDSRERTNRECIPTIDVCSR